MDVRFETFIAVANTKSYTKSAEILNITQPAVSQHIKFLEVQYGAELIKKTGKNIELTKEGFILLEYAQKIDMLYKALRKKITSSSSLSAKTYNIGASMTIGGYVLPYILGEYKRINNNVNMLLQVNNTKEIIAKLISGKIDFALVEGPFDKDKFNFSKFKDDELILAVSPHHDFAKLKKVSIDDVLNGKLILREKGSGTRKIFENKIDEIGYDINSIQNYMEIGSISAIKSMIELNLGYSVISRETIKRELQEGTIIEVPIKDIHIMREFNFVYLYEEEYINEFIRFCVQSLK